MYQPILCITTQKVSMHCAYSSHTLRLLMYLSEWTTSRSSGCASRGCTVVSSRIMPDSAKNTRHEGQCKSWSQEIPFKSTLCALLLQMHPVAAHPSGKCELGPIFQHQRDEVVSRPRKPMLYSGVYVMGHWVGRISKYRLVSWGTGLKRAFDLLNSWRISCWFYFFMWQTHMNRYRG